MGGRHFQPRRFGGYRFEWWQVYFTKLIKTRIQTFTCETCVQVFYHQFKQEITWQCCCCCWNFDIDKADNFKFCIFVVDTLILPLCPNKVVWWALKVMAELPNLCSQDGAPTNFEEARFLTLKRESESGDCKKWERRQPESWRCKGSLWFMVV